MVPSLSIPGHKNAMTVAWGLGRGHSSFWMGTLIKSQLRRQSGCSRLGRAPPRPAAYRSQSMRCSAGQPGNCMHYVSGPRTSASVSVRDAIRTDLTPGRLPRISTWRAPTQPLSLDQSVRAVGRSNHFFSNKGIPYSTSKSPEKSKSPKQSQEEPRKPLLAVLSRLTPREDIYTIPNILTFSRLIAAPVIGYLVLHDYHAWAVGLFAYAGITDLVDGYIARKWNLQTVVGTVIDPMADKTLMTILTVCLAWKGALPVWLAGIILGRDVGLGIAAIYYRWISLPPPKTFSRYWDFSLPSAEVHPTTISKYNTALQLALIGATTAMPLMTVDVSSAMMAMQYLVATTTVWSGASYIYTKDAVKILNREDTKTEDSKAMDPKDKNLR